jgi:hypothetical protein
MDDEMLELDACASSVELFSIYACDLLEQLGLRLILGKESMLHTRKGRGKCVRS